MTKISFSVKLSSFDNEAWDKLRKLGHERAAIVAKAISDFKKSERFKAAVDLAAPDYYGQKDAIVTFEGDSFNVTIPCSVAEEPSATKSPHYPQSLSLYESTLNTLLQGKLLSDSEKRKLISAATGGIIEAEPTKEADQ